MCVFFEEHDTLDPPEPKKRTPFEEKRANARTLQELIELGYEEGMEYPEAWAQRVHNARHDF